MKNKISILKYKKIIMLSLVLISVIIVIAAMYITEFNINKVTREDVLTKTPAGIYKEFKDFDEQFETFKIYLDSEDEFMKDDEGNILEYGIRKFGIETKLKDASDISKVNITLGMGANWVKYISSSASSGSNGIDLNDTDYISFNDLDTLFPLQGKLLFLPKLQPTLYVLIEWSELNTNYHTYVEYEYSQYSIKPVK